MNLNLNYKDDFKNFHNTFVALYVTPRMHILRDEGEPVNTEIFLPKETIITLTRALFGGNVTLWACEELMNGMIREAKADRDPVDWFWKNFFNYI